MPISSIRAATYQVSLNSTSWGMAILRHSRSLKIGSCCPTNLLRLSEENDSPVAYWGKWSTNKPSTRKYHRSCRIESASNFLRGFSIAFCITSKSLSISVLASFSWLRHWEMQTKDSAIGWQRNCTFTRWRLIPLIALSNSFNRKCCKIWTKNLEL